MSCWQPIAQADIDAFAEVTGDWQWIHTNPERASRGPFGGTIAHGYFTLSLAPALLDQLVSFEAFPMAVNYGLDRLRFPAPMPVGDSVRLRARLSAVERFEGGATLAVQLTFESTSGNKPVCVADAVYRVFGE